MRDVLPRWSEILELTRHRTLAFIRQPEAVFWVFAFPLVLSAVLGFAFQGREPAPSRVGVVDAEAAWVARLEADPRLEVFRFDTREDADRRDCAGEQRAGERGPRRARLAGGQRGRRQARQRGLESGDLVAQLGARRSRRARDEGPAPVLAPHEALRLEAGVRRPHRVDVDPGAVGELADTR